MNDSPDQLREDKVRKILDCTASTSYLNTRNLRLILTALLTKFTEEELDDLEWRL